MKVLSTHAIEVTNAIEVTKTKEAAVSTEGAKSSTSATVFNYVKNFSCLADRCQNTCCQGWRIAVGDETANRYRQSQPQLFAILATDAGGYKIAGTEEGGHCSQLKDGLCSMQTTYGEAMLPDICVRFPRMYRVINDLTLGAASTSCPEVTRLCLYDDAPFELAQAEPWRLPEAGSTSVDDLNGDEILRLIQPFIAAALEKSTAAEQSMLNILTAANALQKTSYREWLAAGKQVFDGPDVNRECGKALPGADVQCQDVILVLGEMLSTPHIPDSVREQFYRAIAVIEGNESEAPKLALRDFYLNAYREGAAHTQINGLLKRYLAAEITRTGFPILSQTPFGKDYGHSIAAWAQTLTVRFLALRLLLVSHIQADGTAPSPATVIDLVHRLSRKINHELSGPVEKNFCEKTRDDFPATAINLMALA